MKESLRKQIENCHCLPVLPEITVRLVELCQDPMVDIVRLTRTVSRDPSLSARVLKIVNSPLYGLRVPVSTLSHALSLLGVRGIRTLALSFSMSDCLALLRHQEFDYQSFWRRSVYAGVAAQALAREVHQANPEELFLAALLQDIGILVLLQSMPDCYAPLLREAGTDHQLLCRLEQERLGANHAQVSCWLAERWNLPSQLSQAVRGSHDPLDPSLPPERRAFFSCVALGGLLADVFLNGDAEKSSLLLRTKASSWLGLGNEAVASLLTEVSQMLPEVSSLFDLVTSVEEVQQTLERAREMLVVLTVQQAREMDRTLSELSDENRHLREQTRRDHLTGLASRIYLEAILEHEFEKSERFQQPFSLIFLDVDHFKEINDRLGHDVGDRVLKTIGSLLRRNLRMSDVAGRYGGDEFVVILPNTGSHVAECICRRVTQLVAQAFPDPTQGIPTPVTTSAGFAVHREGHRYPDAGRLVQAADRALLAAKRLGRNRMVGADATQPDPLAPPLRAT